MELHVVLCCVIGVIAAAPPSPSSTNVNQPYDTIVIGLGAAGVTAATTLTKNGKRVLGLEAQDRVGGRVNTVPFGDGVVEVGAEWIHGVEHSRTYNLATENQVTIKQQDEEMEYYSSDGELDVALIKELMGVFDDAENGQYDKKETFATVVTRKITEYLTEKRPDLLKDQDFINEVLAFLNLATNNFEGSYDWTEVPIHGQYLPLGGHQHASWHRNGYKTFFDIMLNKYNNGIGLPGLDIKLGTEVVLIRHPAGPGDKAVVECKDGSVYEADNVIVTVSLGVLKAKHASLFSSPLPKSKVTAIEKISIGVVGKIILSFDQKWWPQNMSFTGFLWKAGDRKKVGQADYWTTKVMGASRPMGSSNTMTLWTGGDVAKQVELLPDDVVQRKAVELLQQFIGNKLNVTVPQPTGIVRSRWFANQFTRGSYSYESLRASDYPNARELLGAPLTDSAGAPRVLFAGEAFSLHHFSTVHGASEEGYSAALKLL